MILAIDIGNTNIVIGGIDKEKTYFIERLSTVRTKTELEYAIDIKTVLDIYHISKDDIEGGIISSVVPQITNIAKLAAEKILKKEVMVLGPGIKTGLNILMDHPGQLGADLVANAVAGLAEYREGVFSGQRAAVYIKNIIPEKMKVKLVLVDAYSSSAPSDYRFEYFETRNHIDRFVYSPEVCDRMMVTDFENDQ